MRILLILIVVIAAVAVAAAAVFFRTVSMPAELWHVDPAQVTPPESPNFDLRVGDAAPVIAAPLSEVAVRLDTLAGAEQAVVIGGAAEDGFVTYVQRSRLMGYPDAISIRLTEVDAGTRIEVYSRSRFGYSDMGVNAARVDRWMQVLSDGS